MNKMVLINKLKTIVALILLLHIFCCSAPKEEPQKSKLQTLKEQFIEQRFGMFICYNIMSYGAKWGEENYPIDTFNPEKLDCNQWADAAISAGMKFGLLTTKHHEGFCLWDSEYTDYDVASTPYKKDIVKQYVDAFRAKGLGIGLYYSIGDNTHGIKKGEITPEKVEFVKGQIRELLTNYGEVEYFVMDSWNWSIGHKDIPYKEIRDLIRELQPNCLITDHTHLQAPYHMEIPYFEGPFGAFPPEGNIMASALGHCSVKGNGWFWSEATPNGMKENDGVDVVLDKLIKCESRYCNFMLNCMPNRDGLLDDIYINMLAEIGGKWKADATRPTLPDQGPQIWETIPIKNATASSGNADNLFDERKAQGGNYNDWEADSGLPQTIIIDLGSVQQNVDVLTIVNKHICKPGPERALEEGNVLKYQLSGSADYQYFENAVIQNEIRSAGYTDIGFSPANWRYLRLEIVEAKGNTVVINELEVGKSQ
ncbi:alpha-L-fucosidase [uncultured Draconibacterium sp.]|uniref:alpha-L-fucosidase n=1 Tax=uncultured Draconibacterium sp. TaxID=1573823 RepID=UPI0025EDE63C|nr:alpha-L-fucosidase [uncultured Draconibacterium sp.]